MQAKEALWLWWLQGDTRRPLPGFLEPRRELVPPTAHHGHARPRYCSDDSGNSRAPTAAVSPLADFNLPSSISSLSPSLSLSLLLSRYYSFTVCNYWIVPLEKLSGFSIFLNPVTLFSLSDTVSSWLPSSSNQKLKLPEDFSSSPFFFLFKSLQTGCQWFTIYIKKTSSAPRLWSWRSQTAACAATGLSGLRGWRRVELHLTCGEWKQKVCPPCGGERWRFDSWSLYFKESKWEHVFARSPDFLCLPLHLSLSGWTNLANANCRSLWDPELRLFD